MPEPVQRAWLVEPLTADVKEAIARMSRLPGVRRISIMPDVHLAGRACVGCVVATKDAIYPDCVGSDIGCGLATLRLDGPALTAEGRRDTLRAWAETVPALRHGTPARAPWPDEAPDPRELSHPALSRTAGGDGRIEMGTLGRGNHFLELQIDENAGLWIMVHSGSRVMGQAISAAHQGDRARGGFRRIAADSLAGEAYLRDVEWAERYASASRLAMLRTAAKVAAERLGLAPCWDTLVNISHNHVRREAHFGEPLLVHRKGAAPAGADEPGLIPGSMGTPTYHVGGRGNPDALCSSSHGAGRALTRAQARRAISPAALRAALETTTYDERRATGLVEEAPQAYKDIEKVMRAQRDLVRIVRVVRPVVTYKAT